MPSLATCWCPFRLMRYCFLVRWTCLPVSEVGISTLDGTSLNLVDIYNTNILLPHIINIQTTKLHTYQVCVEYVYTFVCVYMNISVHYTLMCISIFVSITNTAIIHYFYIEIFHTFVLIQILTHTLAVCLWVGFNYVPYVWSTVN